MTTHRPPQNQAKNPLDYAQAGVDIAAGNRLVNEIKPLVAGTQRPGMLSGIGGFGGLFALPSGYEEPILVSGTDGVGTKLKLAIQLGIHDTVGIDLVAMCVNDIIVAGAEPLFFLDYYASGKLDVDVARQVISGIAEGCKLAGAGLIGGETAELPGMYHDGDYDLAGFAVGIVERKNLVDNQTVEAGDVVLGLGASGPHSNGYSLIRKVLEIAEVGPDSPFGDTTLGQALLTPTRIYVRSLLAALKTPGIHALAHITGGGIVENLPRVLPAGLQATLSRRAWDMPAVFSWLQEKGDIADLEMLRTFNCGVGMTLIVDPIEANRIAQVLSDHGETVFELGHIEPGSNGVTWT
ncbi:MAG: phosphoribosylformylglycinamidine cyclo-ligase [Pseudomonadota bacterium]